MKLIFCESCRTVTGLAYEVRSCLCGASQGVYLDNRQAIYHGPCIPLGIHNGTFADALAELSDIGDGLLANEFIGFIIPRDSPYFRDVGAQAEKPARTVGRRRPTSGR